MGNRNSKSLKEKMSGKWLQAFNYLSPTLSEAIKNVGDNVPCPVHGGVDGFRLFKDVNETGGGVKQCERVIPGGIDMLMWVNEWSFIKTFDELSAWLDGEPSRKSSPIILPCKNNQHNEAGLRRWLNTIWKEGLPLDHRKSYPARAYFGRRKMTDAAYSACDIRFHPCLNYKDKDGKLLGRFGAILCLVRNNEGLPVQITRTFLTKGGLKINLGKKHKAKKHTPPVNKNSRGRQIRLFQPINGYVGVAEGLETALAVYQAKGFPVWPNLANTNLVTFCPPQGVHTVLNFVDKDRNKAGEKSAEILRSNLEMRGIRVIDLLPPTPILESDDKGVDWADQLVRDRSGFDLIDQVLFGDYKKTA